MLAVFSHGWYGGISSNPFRTRRRPEFVVVPNAEFGRPAAKAMLIYHWVSSLGFCAVWLASYVPFPAHAASEAALLRWSGRGKGMTLSYYRLSNETSQIARTLVRATLTHHVFDNGAADFPDSRSPVIS